MPNAVAQPILAALPDPGAARFVAAPHCLTALLGDEGIVLDLECGVYYGLNPAAATVWRRLSTARSLDELTAAVEAEFDTAGCDARRDVRQLLAALCAHGLVATAAA